MIRTQARRENHVRRPISLWIIKRIGLALTYLFIWMSVLIIGYPVLWMVIQSFKSTNEMYRNIWGLPREWRFDNYVRAWEVSNIGTYIFNSLFVSFATVVLVLIIASMASFAFAKMPFYGGRAIFFVFIITFALPMPIIPLYAIISNLNLTNTHLGLILPYTASGLPIAIFLLTAVFANIPRELDDAAIMDGCSDFKRFWHIALPLARPGIATVVILQFVASWNEFFLALVLVRSRNVRTIPVGLQAFFHEYMVDWGALFATLSIATIPIIIVYIAMQRLFISGLTAGAIKG